jgi:hypothetical protein
MDKMEAGQSSAGNKGNPITIQVAGWVAGSKREAMVGQPRFTFCLPAPPAPPAHQTGIGGDEVWLSSTID